MISTSTNKLKVVFRYGLWSYRINVEQVFSSPERKVLRVSYCDRPMSVVRQQFL